MAGHHLDLDAVTRLWNDKPQASVPTCDVVVRTFPAVMQFPV